jgi:hypothetical protein
MLNIEIKNVVLTIGAIYGPNNNDVEFYRCIERKTRLWGNPCILGGDFNTILSDTPGVDNLDRDGAGRVPNRQNSRIINEWITSGIFIDPFRALYPHTREFSYIPFRGQNAGNREAPRISKSRLDFFLVTPNILDVINKVTYEDRIGSDFDHKEVTLEIGKKTKGAKITIYDSTLNDETANDAVNMVVYESLAVNLTHKDIGIENNVAQLGILLRDKEKLLNVRSIYGVTDEINQRIQTVNENIIVIKNRLPRFEQLMEREYICNYRVLYEGVIHSVKNILLNIQRRRSKEENVVRDKLVKREEYIKTVFGEYSQQWYDAKDAIFRYDDARLKERATRFKEFLDKNNEKATKAFCRLSKEGGGQG